MRAGLIGSILLLGKEGMRRRTRWGWWGEASKGEEGGGRKGICPKKRDVQGMYFNGAHNKGDGKKVEEKSNKKGHGTQIQRKGGEGSGTIEHQREFIGTWG